MDQVSRMIILEAPIKRNLLTVALTCPFVLHPYFDNALPAIAEHGAIWFPLMTFIRYRFGRHQHFEFGEENIRGWIVVPALLTIPVVAIKWLLVWPFLDRSFLGLFQSFEVIHFKDIV